MGAGAPTLAFAPPADESKRQDALAARDRLFSGLPLGTLAKAVGVTPDEIIAALLDEQYVLSLMLDTALADGDIATAQHIASARLLASQALPGHVILPLALKARLPLLSPDVAARLLIAPAWVKAVSDLPSLTPPASQRDDGRLIFMATLMPREAMPAFIESLAPLPLAITRAPKDFADLILALPPDGKHFPEHAPHE
jgi:hypothetical protein